MEKGKFCFFELRTCIQHGQMSQFQWKQQHDSPIILSIKLSWIYRFRHSYWSRPFTLLWTWADFLQKMYSATVVTAGQVYFGLHNKVQWTILLDHLVVAGLLVYRSWGHRNLWRNRGNSQPSPWKLMYNWSTGRTSGGHEMKSLSEYKHWSEILESIKI